MAITKIFAIKNRLDKRINYVLDKEKTSASPQENDALDMTIQYALNRDKTEAIMFETAVNCYSTETAFEEMQKTQIRYDKTDKRLGYHIIQSFAPGEVTAEEAHAIGIEFANRCFDERYEMVIGTHLNKAHLHNHIVMNAVSFIDGRKFHLPHNGYARMRSISDEICREHGLSVIEQPKSKSQTYAQWQAENQGKPTIRSQIRKDIDHVIKQSFNYSTFLQLLQKKGYQIKRSSNIKHTAIKPPYGKKFIRLDSLGTNYTEQAIIARTEQQTSWQRPSNSSITKQKRIQRYRYHAGVSGKRKITGFAALYLLYVYLLRANQKGSTNAKVSRFLLEDTIRFKQITTQAKFLLQYNIANKDDLSRTQAMLTSKITDITTHRKPLYRLRQQATEPAEKEKISRMIQQDTDILREYRRQLHIAQKIAEEAEQREKHIKQAIAMNKENHCKLLKEHLQCDYERALIR